MNSEQAHTVVALSLVVMLGYGLINKSGTQISSYTQIWAVFVLGFILSFISDLAPGIGGPLAIVIALGFIFKKNNVNSVITNALQKKTTSVSSQPVGG